MINSSLSVNTSAVPSAFAAISGVSDSLNDVFVSLRNDGYLPEMALGGAGEIYCRRFGDDARSLSGRLEGLANEASDIKGKLGFSMDGYRDSELATLGTMALEDYPSAPAGGPRSSGAALTAKEISAAGVALGSGASGLITTVPKVFAAANSYTEALSQFTIPPSRIVSLGVGIQEHLEALRASGINLAIAAFWIANGLSSSTDSAIDHIIETWWQASYKVGEVFNAVDGVKGYILANWQGVASDAASAKLDGFIKAGKAMATAITERAERLAAAVRRINDIYEMLFAVTLAQVIVIVAIIACAVFDIATPLLLTYAVDVLSAWVNLGVFLLIMAAGSIVGGISAA